MSSSVSTSGHLLLQMSIKSGELPNRLNIDVFYLHNNEHKISTSNNNTILFNLAFIGDALIKIEHPEIAPKHLYISRLHSSPFPKKGGFCLSIELQPKLCENTKNSDELIKIYSEDYIEYYFFDSKSQKQRRSIHNLSKPPALGAKTL